MFTTTNNNNTNNNSSNNNTAAKVLYIDYQGHPAPLSRCFHATASRQLSSSVTRDPPTTKHQVDSAYCPQCLSVHDAATAATLGHCPTCKQCPLCMAVASVTVSNKEAFYKCGYCHYTSRECGITTLVMTAGEDESIIGKEVFLKVTKELAKLVDTRMEESQSSAKQHYQDLMNTYETTVKSSSTSTKQQQPKLGKRTLLSSNQQQQAWSLEALEESLLSKQTLEKEQYDNENKVSVLDDSPLMLDKSLQDVACTSLLMQNMATAVVSSTTALIPLKIPLRSRTSIRCRAELEQGRPGILVKPKLNPLEGDSSLRSGHGQWWKKDSSALYVIPKVRVVRSNNNNNKSFLLKVTNPTMSAVKLRLGPSTYTGEDETTPNVMMKHVLMDSLELDYKDIVLLATSSTFALEQPTELVQLESVEDCFLEMGRATLPEAVVNWVGGSDDLSSCSIQFIALQKDAAWFELNVGNVNVSAAASKDTWVALALALQIQVGDGSWESSLVKPKPMPGGEPDLVTFHVLIAWDPAEGGSE